MKNRKENPHALDYQMISFAHVVQFLQCDPMHASQLFETFIAVKNFVIQSLEKNLQSKRRRRRKKKCVKFLQSIS